jgi:hypothetical protein
LGLEPNGGTDGIVSGTLDPVEYLPLRPDDLLETRFRFSMSLRRKGGAVLWLLDAPLDTAKFGFDAGGAECCAIMPPVSGEVELDSSLLLETLSCSGNMLVNEVPATVHVLPLCPPPDVVCTAAIAG